MGTGKKLLCVCQICTCGRHHCVHHPKAHLAPKGPCALTEYKDTYRKFSNYEPSKSIKPDAATHLSKDPFDSNTSYKQVYVSHPFQPRSKREQKKYIKPDGNFDGTSSYQHDYIEKVADKMPSARPVYHPTTSDRPFSGTTVHKETYRPWDLPVNRGIRPTAAIKLPTSNFDHKTTFQDDFQGHKGRGREAIKPPEPALAVGTGPFADETTTRHDYTKKDALPMKSAKPAQNILRHSDPFDHRSTAQHTYGWPQGKPADSCKPEEMVRCSSQPLDSDTTHRITYKAWDIPKRQGWKPRSGWTAPLDPFDHKTTFQHDYSGKPVRPAKSARPDYNRLAPGEFDGLTTHKDAYKPWEVNARAACRPAEGYRGPHGKFDGQTTFQTDYKGFKSSRPDLCIPKGGGISFDGPQDFGTMYNNTYLGERPPTCPAKYLEARENIRSSNGYRYKLDQNGHQFFRPPYVRESMENLGYIAPHAAHKNGSIEVLAL